MQALQKLEATVWTDAIAVLQAIPENSFYHQKALQKIEESNRRIIEEELVVERAARQLAEQSAEQQEEARKLAEREAEQEQQARKDAERVAAKQKEARRVAEQVATQAEEARRAAELVAAREEEARKVAEQKAGQEAIKRALAESARNKAEQRAALERLAKEQQQRATESQTLLAEQREQARVLELAKTNPLIKAVISGELKFYIEPLPSYAGAGVSSAVESMAGDFSSWEPYGLATVRRVYDENDADLTVSWIRDYGPHTLGQSIRRFHIKVGLGTSNCEGDWSAFDANTVKKVLWHELGHSMGYGHSSNPGNVMYYQTATRFVVEQEVSLVISGGWSYWFLLCDSGAYSYSFEADNPSTGFDIFVIPPGVDAKSFATAGGSFYVGCGKESVYRYSGSCTVANGARIHISNNSRTTALRLDGLIVNKSSPPWPDMTWDSSAYQYDRATLMRYRELFQ